MTNPIIETDLGQILGQISQKLDKLSDDVGEVKVGQAKLEGRIETLDQKLSGQIREVDERLSGKIEALDQKLSGQIKAMDTKIDQLEKRVGNQEFINRGTFGGIVLLALGGIVTGAVKLFSLIKP
jgi:chromosome segregation ATPase